jgi:bifunctional non-homologous end joining protein LigD
VDDIEHADRIVIDLDPGTGVAWERVVETAVALRELMRKEGLESWPKLTGSKSVHLTAPLASPMTHDAARLCKTARAKARAPASGALCADGKSCRAPRPDIPGLSAQWPRAIPA